MNSRSTIVAFTGPSIRREKALEILGPDGVALPPAAAGDLIRALRLRPRAIILVDGRFDDVPAPWHKELLLAIELGVKVYGGSSMGALRAIECERFGAVAIGKIADSYRSGRREDDAVAISHLPEVGGWRPISAALVDIEDAIENSVESGVVTPDSGSELIRRQRETPFPQRRMPDLPSAPEAAPGLKERDALLTCRTAVETSDRGRPGIRVPRTTWLLRLARIALGSPFPICEGLPEHEVRFQEMTDRAPWIAPLCADAITFRSVTAPIDRATLSRSRREEILRYHLSRVRSDGEWVETGKELAEGVARKQIAIIESSGNMDIGDGPCRLLDQDQGSGARDDALARVLRSEGIPPLQDRLLEDDPADLAGMIDELTQQ